MFVITEDKTSCLNILYQNICNLQHIKQAFATGEQMLIMMLFLGRYGEITSSRIHDKKSASSGKRSLAEFISLQKYVYLQKEGF
jgi:hypothetical protein